ncbi:TPA: hypothetical protein ACOEPM_001763 [Stenotrophomonas maltophilia]
MSLPLRLALLPTLLASASAFAACPAPPPGQPDIRAIGYYTDKVGSVSTRHCSSRTRTPLHRWTAMPPTWRA